MKTIIFDIDGTLFNTKHGIIECLNDILICFGHEKISKNNENKYIGPAIKDSLMKFDGFSEEMAVEATKMYREKYVEKYVEKSIPYEGMIEVLNYLENNQYRICIATMKTQRQVDKILDMYNIKTFFEIIQTAKEVGGYTKFDMLEYIKNNYKEDTMYFVGDTMGDYYASAKNGIKFIYAKYGYGNVEATDCICINELNEILKYL